MKFKRTQARKVRRASQYLARMHCGARPLESAEEVERLLAALRGRYVLRDRALLVLGLYSGLRVGSALSLTIGDVFDGSRFRKSMRVARKSMKGRRQSFVVPLHPRAKRAIARWLVTVRKRGQGLDPKAPLFSSRQQGRAMSARMAQILVAEAADRAGLGEGISTHSWRKTFASRLYDATGHCLLTVGAVLAHSPADVRTTARYLRFCITEKANDAVLHL